MAYSVDHNKMENKKLIEKIEKLSKKYSATGQDLYSYLDGLLYSDYIGYWNYIHLDTLLSLQNPKTEFPDEKIFIIYHQITELYFQLCLLELEQINKNGRHVLETGEDLGWKKKLTLDVFIEKMQRVNRYVKNLVDSFDIMISGMNRDEFLKFRMALLPSSGFQSVQYRMIELRSTRIEQIVSDKNNSSDLDSLYKKLYWKSGANELSSGKKTYTLEKFEKKYDHRLKKLTNKMVEKNVWSKYLSLSKKDQSNQQLIKLLKEYDYTLNIEWKLAHYKSAVKYLKSNPKNIKATGGTNWQKYLPPKYQKIIFFPKLWSKEERENWGKKWIDSINPA